MKPVDRTFDRALVVPPPEPDRRLNRLAGHLASPLLRSGYSLVATVGLTSILGLVYWVLAARLYNAETLGLNAALVSAMTVLSGIAQLNLPSVLTRFLPGTGPAGPRW